MASLSLYSQSTIDLYPGAAPFNKTGIEVPESNENDRVSGVTRPQLYHYPAQDSSSGPRPAIIICPGGGYMRQAFGHEGTMVAQWMAERGFEAFILKYRLPDEDLFDRAHLVPLMDVQEAVHLVRSRADELGVVSSQIGVMGFSAGGHLAASAATLFTTPPNEQRSPEELRPDFSVLIYPVITMDTAYTHMGSRQNLIGRQPGEDLVQRFSLELQCSAQTPPTFILHAADDRAVPVQNTEAYAGGLQKHGVPFTKIILPEGGHGFGFRTEGPAAYWTSYLDTWLKAFILTKSSNTN